MTLPAGTYEGVAGSDSFQIRLDLAPPQPNALPRLSGDVFLGPAEPARYILSFYSRRAQITFHDNGLVEANLRVYQRWPQEAFFEGNFQVYQRAPDVFPAGLFLYTPQGSLARSFEMTLHRSSQFFRAFDCLVDFQDETAEPALLASLHQTIDARLADMRIACRTTLAPAPFRDGTLTSWNENALYEWMYASFPTQQPSGMAWRVSLLLVNRFRDPNTAGIMFDNADWDSDHRQGAAVFWAPRVGASFPPLKEGYCRTVIHELGHAFNLMHSFEPAKPGGPRYDSLSFMNYPHKYSGGGEASYWNQFAWQFDEDERNHICHNFLDEVVMGGAQFGWAPYERVAPLAAEGRPLAGLCLELRVRRYGEGAPQTPTFQWTEPIILEAKLARDKTRTAEVADTLEPAFGETIYLIEQPGGKVNRFQPLWNRCHEGRAEVLGPGRPALFEEVDLTFGTRGFYFQEPGRYRVQALRWLPQGLLRSAPLTLHVAYPSRQLERRAVGLLDARMGVYAATRGIPSLEDFAQGRLEALNALPARTRHPWTDFYRRCQALLLTKGVKRIVGDQVQCWRPSERDPIPFLAQMVGLKRDGTRSSRKPARLTNLAFSQLSGDLARLLLEDNKIAVATRVLQHAVDFLALKGLPAAMRRNYVGKHDPERRAQTKIR